MSRSNPPTYEEMRDLSLAVLRGEVEPSAVLECLDTDRYFEACSVDDLEPEDVETIVRWARREFVVQMIVPGVRCGSFGDEDSGTEFACTVRSGRFYAKGRSERDLAHAAMERALDHLQQLNGGKP